MVSSAHNYGRNRNAHAAALDRWESEGGTIDARRRDPLTKEEAHILRFLGASLLSRWNGLPKHIQQELFEHSFEAVLPDEAARLKKRIARFLHNHKDDVGGVV